MQLTWTNVINRKLPEWLFDSDRKVVINYTEKIENSQFAIINTLEGDMRANANDWIIRGINGELYPCKPDIFEKTYEIVI